MARRLKSKCKKEKYIEKEFLVPAAAPTFFFIVKNAIGGMIAFFTVEMFKKFKNKKK
jgi:hypothetical protein